MTRKKFNIDQETLDEWERAADLRQAYANDRPIDKDDRILELIAEVRLHRGQLIVLEERVLHLEGQLLRRERGDA